MQRKTKENFESPFIVWEQEPKFLKVQICKRLLICKVKFRYLRAKVMA